MSQRVLSRATKNSGASPSTSNSGWATAKAHKTQRCNQRREGARRPGFTVAGHCLSAARRRARARKLPHGRARRRTPAGGRARPTRSGFGNSALQLPPARRHASVDLGDVGPGAVRAHAGEQLAVDEDHHALDRIAAAGIAGRPAADGEVEAVQALGRLYNPTVDRGTIGIAARPGSLMAVFPSIRATPVGADRAASNSAESVADSPLPDNA